MLSRTLWRHSNDLIKWFIYKTIDVKTNFVKQKFIAMDVPVHGLELK